MTTIRHYTDILAWQKGETLCSLLFVILKGNRDFSFVDQIKRSSMSILNNIAEGYGRYGVKEFRQFLTIAKGSNMETQSMVHLGFTLHHFTEKQRDDLVGLTDDINHLLKALINSLKDFKK